MCVSLHSTVKCCHLTKSEKHNIQICPVTQQIHIHAHNTHKSKVNTTYLNSDWYLYVTIASLKTSLKERLILVGGFLCLFCHNNLQSQKDKGKK